MLAASIHSPIVGVLNSLVHTTSKNEAQNWMWSFSHQFQGIGNFDGERGKEAEKKTQ